MRVFLVDDSSLMRKELTDLILGVEGVEIVGEAGNVPDAEKAIVKIKPDVVILDIQLRWGSGIDVLKTVKKYSPATKVIVCTSYPHPQYREICLDLGADFFLDKYKEIHKIPELLKQ